MREGNIAGAQSDGNDESDCGFELNLFSSPPQLLYSTYIFSSARRSINVDVGLQREVYDQLQPAFEELFDDVQDHALNILLEPWTLLVSRDKKSLQQVFVLIHVYCIWENSDENPKSNSKPATTNPQAEQGGQ